MARRVWVYVGGRAGSKPPSAEKAAITVACERLIAEVLRPRFLPEIRPSTFSYPVAIDGKWHGNKYRFFTRYHSDDARSGSEPSPARRQSGWFRVASPNDVPDRARFCLNRLLPLPH
jgi:hypothetical protein